MAQEMTVATNEMKSSPIVFGSEVTAIPDKGKVENQELKNEILENKVRETAKKVKHAGRDIKKKASIMLVLKNNNPDIDLRKFVDMYLGGNNFEDLENFEIADEIENHFNLKKSVKKLGHSAGKVGKVVASVASSKVGSSIIGGVASIVGTPAAGAAIVAGLGAVRKVMEKGKELNIPVDTIKKIIDKPETATAVQIQALVPENGVHAVLAKLVPLETSMKSTLASKGVTTTQDTTLEDLATMFHDKVVKGKDNFDTSWYKNDVMYHEPAHYFEQNHFDFSKAGEIVNDIIGFFDKSKKNPETPIEVKSGEDVKKIEKKIETDIQKDIAQKVDKAQLIDKGFSTNTIIMFAVVAVVLFFVMKK